MTRLHDTKLANQLYSTSKLNNVLSRLDGVHKSGDGFRAKCPAHGGDNDSILSVRETEDGHVLLHCFHDCSVVEILDSIGLTWPDIMPERLTHHAPPEKVRKWREDALHRDWTATMKDALYECYIVQITGEVEASGEQLSDEWRDRRNLAIKRMESVTGLFNGKS